VPEVLHCGAQAAALRALPAVPVRCRQAEASKGEGGVMLLLTKDERVKLAGVLVDEARHVLSSKASMHERVEQAIDLLQRAWEIAGEEEGT
jgi:hypothetical protein